jgi:ACS family hexuronate transporter-like MFS transporter
LQTAQVDPSVVQPRVRSLLKLRPVWGVVLLRAFTGPVSQFYWTWLPLYLSRERGMSLKEIGMVAWMPYFCGGVGNIGGGALSSLLVKRGTDPVRARKCVITMGTVLCLLATLVPLAHTPAAAVALICLEALGVNAVSVNHMAVITDIFPDAIAARVSGMTGVGDGTVTMMVILLTGVVVDHFSYSPIFILIGVMPVLALILTLALVRRLPGPQEAAT